MKNMLNYWLTLVFFALVLQTFSQCPCDTPSNYQVCNTVNNTVPDYVNPIPGLEFTFSVEQYSTAPRYGELQPVGGCGSCTLNNSCNCPYGSNTWNPASCCEDLFMNIYMPCNEFTDRPAVVLASGGGFQDNSPCRDKVQYLAKELVSRGYVVAAISYRKFKGSRPMKCSATPGYNFIDYYNDLSSCGASAAEDAKLEMFYKTAQDGKAAVKFLKENASFFGVDVNHVFFAGMSAGASVALHTAYLDATDLPVGWSGYTDWGGFHEFAVPTTQNDKLAGVLDLWGAIGDLAWIENVDVPLFITHGTCDPVVHYQIGNLLGGMNGAEPMTSSAYNKNTPVQLLSICQGKHGLLKADAGCNGYSACTAFDNLLITKMCEFMRDITTSSLPLVEVEAAEAADFPGCLGLGPCTSLTPQLVDVTGAIVPLYCPQDLSQLNTTYRLIPKEMEEETGYAVYPNPVRNGWIRITSPHAVINTVSLTDLMGRRTNLRVQNDKGEFTVDIGDFPPGTYILQIDESYHSLVISE